MTTGIRRKSRLLARQYRSTPYPLPCWEISDKDLHHKKKCPKSCEKGDWEDAVCSVCLEYPHNAVLLLCSSHDKGCRPYMCATNYRFSNCLDQFEKAYTKTMSPPREEPWNESAEDASAGVDSTTTIVQKSEVMDLICPLCRGQVKGWTVVEAAREFLNAKKRSCMQENCPFAGTYKELKKHVKREHPSARPREVDPALEQKWKRLQNERDRDDVISTIRSSMPGAMVLGDYVIERNHHHNNFVDMEDDEGVDEDGVGYEMGIDNSNFLNVLFLLQAIGPNGSGSLNSRFRRIGRGYRSLLDGEGGRGSIPSNAQANSAAPIEVASEDDEEEEEEEEEEDDVTLLGRRQGRVMRLGRSQRRRRRRTLRRPTLGAT